MGSSPTPVINLFVFVFVLPFLFLFLARGHRYSTRRSQWPGASAIHGVSCCRCANRPCLMISPVDITVGRAGRRCGRTCRLEQQTGVGWFIGVPDTSPPANICVCPPLRQSSSLHLFLSAASPSVFLAAVAPSSPIDLACFPQRKLHHEQSCNLGVFIHGELHALRGAPAADRTLLSRLAVLREAPASALCRLIFRRYALCCILSCPWPSSGHARTAADCCHSPSLKSPVTA